MPPLINIVASATVLVCCCSSDIEQCFVCYLLCIWLDFSWLRVIYLLPWLQVRNNLLEPVIQVLVRNGPRYNLLNSAVLEMVEFVRKENVRYIIQHLVEQFWPQLESCDYVGTFAALKLKHEQNQVSSALPEPACRRQAL